MCSRSRLKAKHRLRTCTVTTAEAVALKGLSRTLRVPAPQLITDIIRSYLRDLDNGVRDPLCLLKCGLVNPRRSRTLVRFYYLDELQTSLGLIATKLRISESELIRFILTDYLLKT